MAVYTAVHSALASETAKRAAARIVGEKARDVGYRPFYLAPSALAQSALATWALVRAVEALPERTLAVYPRPVVVTLQAAHAAAGFGA